MKVVGLMSGTSADAIDVIIIEIHGVPPALEITSIYSGEYPLDKAFQAQIHACGHPDRGMVDAVCRLNRDMGLRFGQAVIDAVRDAGLSLTEIDLIGCSGQTIWHDIDDTSGDVRATLQVGEPAEVAQMTGITTVSDLRTRDVAVGGHGAPLTAYIDWLLLRHPTAWRAVQNIGGIGNVTFLPPLNDTESQPLAFDTGPGNALIDGVVLSLTDGAMTYDRDGELSASGAVSTGWLESLIVDDGYYQQAPPKTTGRERYGADRVKELVQEGRAQGLSSADIVATVTALTAQSIADAYQQFAPHPVDEIILGGGGARNSTLVHQLQLLMDPATVRTHEDVGLDSDSKEALVIAVLTYETWHMRPGNLPALTGARERVVMGQITPGNNYIDLVRRTWCNATSRP